MLQRTGERLFKSKVSKKILMLYQRELRNESIETEELLKPFYSYQPIKVPDFELIAFADDPRVLEFLLSKDLFDINYEK